MLHALNAPLHLRPAAPLRLGPDPAALRERVVVDFNGPQFEFVTNADVPILAYVAGVGSGKTFALNWWVVFEQYYNRFTGTVGGLFANTYQQLEQATLPGLWDAYEQLGFEYGEHYVYGERPPRFWGEYRSNFKRHNGVISHRFLGQIITRSLDNPHAIRGIEIGYAAHDEMRDSNKTAFNVLLGRIRCPLARRHRYRGSTTPNGFDWVYELFAEKQNPRFGLVRGRTHDNFALPGDYITNLEATYDPKHLRQEVGGEFLNTTSGAVYHQFDRRVHVRPDLAVDPKAEWQVCFDFNRTPMCVVLCQSPVDSKGVKRVHCLDEVRLFESGSHQAAVETLDKIFRHCGGKPVHVDIFGDVSGTFGSTRSALSDYDQIVNEFEKRIKNRYGRRWNLSAPAVADRVNAVNAMLRNGRGEVRCYVHPRCEHLIRDFERVTYVVGGSQIKKTGTDEEKLLTHLTDGLGYYIESVFPVRSEAYRGRLSI